MRRTLDTDRLLEVTLEEQKKTSIFVENQFPAIYRENGRELVELVKAYYRFLEENKAQSIYNIRRIYEYRNIDSTLDRMLVFFKNKFLNGLFFEIDTRFLVKNILDLYRRKGSKEGIELFFKLFFDSEAEIYFPSQDMFKPSNSLWKTGSFLQMVPTPNTKDFEGIVNKRIFGDVSNASAFVGDVFFININGANVPIIFLNNVKGEFIGFDQIYSLNPLIFYGSVYGSLRSVEILPSGQSTSNNNIGDIVDIKSDSGFGAKGRVSGVTQELTGEIDFQIVDGSYGYTTSNTSILVSDQTLFFSDTEANDFNIIEKIQQEKSDTTVFGKVLGTNSDSMGIYLDYTDLEEQTLLVSTSGTEFDPNEKIVQIDDLGRETFGVVILEQENLIRVQLDKSDPELDPKRYFFKKGFDIATVDRQDNISKFVTEVEDDYFFEDHFNIETVDREQNISRTPLFVTPRNISARAEIGTIENTETITIITDLIENYLDVPIDSNNYSEVPPALLEMSGTKVNGVIPDLNTPLNEAFVPETFTIGSIASLKNINPGIDNTSRVFVLPIENLLRRFNLRDQILNVSIPSGISLFEGDKINQTKTIETFEGTAEQVTVTGVVVAVRGNAITVKQTTFESFVTDEPFFKDGVNIPITIISRTRDFNSLPLGLNANIEGNVELLLGRITEVEVFNSGIGYEDGSTVEIVETKKRRAVINDLESQLETFSQLKAEFEELKDTFGFSDATEAIKKRWNLEDIANAFLEGGQGQQPARDLFVIATIPETGLSVADVDQNGTFEFEDYTSFLEYIENIDDDTWRGDNQALVIYIETVMFPYMEDNYTDYQIYGVFSLSEFNEKKSRLDELFNLNLDSSIFQTETQIDDLSTQIDAVGVANARSQGISEGKWLTFKSHVNQEKVIQDSFFYQDFSYELTVDIPQEEYEIEFKEIIHPSGIKLFTKLGIEGDINTSIDILRADVIVEELE